MLPLFLLDLPSSFSALGLCPCFAGPSTSCSTSRTRRRRVSPTVKPLSSALQASGRSFVTEVRPSSAPRGFTTPTHDTQAALLTQSLQRRDVTAMRPVTPDLAQGVRPFEKQVASSLWSLKADFNRRLSSRRSLTPASAASPAHSASVSSLHGGDDTGRGVEAPVQSGGLAFAGTRPASGRTLSRTMPAHSAPRLSTRNTTPAHGASKCLGGSVLHVRPASAAPFTKSLAPQAPATAAPDSTVETSVHADDDALGNAAGLVAKLEAEVLEWKAKFAWEARRRDVFGIAQVDILDMKVR